MISIFNACLAQKPKREDIITFYMNSVHVKLVERLKFEWDARAVKFDANEIFELLDWTYEYHNKLTLFGVRDDRVENGYLVLCRAYAEKIQGEIHDLITNVLINERRSDI